MTVTTAPTGESVIPGCAPRWLRGIFFANLLAQAGIVVTGAIVRLTGSGLGCPTWPECVEGSYVPTSRQEEAWHKYVEFGNRLLTFVLALLAIAAVTGALVWWRQMRARGAPARTPVLVLACVPLVGTATQAVLGGVTVLTGLNPWAVAAHFLVSMAIIAACALLVVRAGEQGDQPTVTVVRPQILWLGRLLLLATFAVVVLGVVVTGSGPHSGDSDTEARFGVDPRTVAWLHADAVLLFLGLCIGLIVALSVTSGPARSRTLAWWLLGVAIAQGVIGYSQYFSGLPWLLVAVHVTGACAVWILSLLLLFSMKVRGTRAVETSGSTA